jgi:hypothetical protein
MRGGAAAAAWRGAVITSARRMVSGVILCRTIITLARAGSTRRQVRERPGFRELEEVAGVGHVGCAPPRSGGTSPRRHEALAEAAAPAAFAGAALPVDDAGT